MWHDFTFRIGGVEATDITDAAHPLVHLLFSVCHQVKDPVDSLDVKDEAVLQVLLVEGETGVHLLAQVQIDHADGLLGMVILVILQHIWVSCQPPTAQNKPSLLPCLKGERRTFQLRCMYMTGWRRSH